MWHKRHRQYHTFRSRILRMFAEKEDFIEWAHEALEYYYDEDLAQRKRITDKDARIAELEKWVNDNAYLVEIHKTGDPPGPIDVEIWTQED